MAYRGILGRADRSVRGVPRERSNVVVDPIALAAFAGGMYALTASVRHYVTVRSSREERVREPPGTVSVLVPTLNEEDYVGPTVRTLRAQTLVEAFPEDVEVILVDSASQDATVAAARPYVDRVVTAPRGKLNALAVAVEAARGELIVEADADGLYPPGWLNLLLEPYRGDAGDPVAGVYAPFVYYDSPVVKFLSPAIRATLMGLGNFPGGARSYRRSAYEAAGGFRRGVDQRDFWALWTEEEFLFPKRLAEVGRVVFNPRAGCFKSARRLDPFFLQDARNRRWRASLDEDGTRFGGDLNRKVRRVVERISGR